jgi:hypothetical protein
MSISPSEDHQHHLKVSYAHSAEAQLLRFKVYLETLYTR